MHPLTLIDRGIEVALVIVLIIGGYQFYFWAQRQRWVTARRLETSWDGLFSYDPRWVWVYVGMYYPVIVLAALSIPTWTGFAHTVGGYMFLLSIQVAIFLAWPIEIPAHWRTLWRGPFEGTLSQRFLDLVWHFDKLRNSNPSMHVSVAMMTDLVIWREWPTLGLIGLAFPILIAISAVKTKQHYVVDVIPGAALGALTFWLWAQIILTIPGSSPP